MEYIMVKGIVEGEGWWVLSRGLSDRVFSIDDEIFAD